MCRRALVVAVVSGVLAAHAAEDFRPPFDKTPYLKTVWSQANPWWLPNKDRRHGRGGPDFAWDRYPHDEVAMWKQVAERCHGYGITGLQMEFIVTNAGFVGVYKNALEGFRQSGTGMKAGIFLTTGSKEEEYVRLFDTIMPIATEHPNAYRLNGMPVAVIYSWQAFKAGEWKRMIEAVEEKHGRIIWLINAAHCSEEWLREALPHVDGISMYACWGVEGQRQRFDWIGRLMREEYPQKIFEAAAHTTWFVHFHYGGIVPRLTRKFRGSCEVTVAAKPDAFQITNWFDTYENSRAMPSYELDDSMLRIAEHYIARWRGESVRETEHPDLYVSNYINVLLGQPIAVEVLGFPVKGDDRTVRIQVELVDGAENLLHTFPAEELVLDDLKAAVFEIGSEDFAGQRAVLPRLRYTWRGREHVTNPFPQTTLVTSIRAHLLFWSRSVRRMIEVDGTREWTLNGVANGGTVRWQPDGVGFVHSAALTVPTVSERVKRGGDWVRILRNGRELDSFAWDDLNFTTFLYMPNPLGTLDWYNVELENDYGGKYLSLPVWVSSGSRDGMVSLPILLPDDSVKTVEVEGARVPFFHYRCDRGMGEFLYDSSGYRHHGCVGVGRVARLPRTAYRHEHHGILRHKPPKVRRGPDGTGWLQFEGEDSAMIMGGTAFPYACTYELAVRPDAIGKAQTVVGTANGQMNIKILADGRVRAARTQAVEGMGGEGPKPGNTVEVWSKESLREGEWTRIAVVYDMKRMTLYIDGVKQAAVEAVPNRDHERINAVVLGGGCKFPYYSVPEFKGGLRNIRIYGRNLSPDEFLENKAMKTPSAPTRPLSAKD